jgi:transcriptional regulator with XRE-family HTH domain
VTQCVIALSDDRVRIAQAEGRRPGVAGTIFRYRVRDGLPQLSAAPAAARLSAALRAVRLQRGLNQADLAGLAGVSPSAISQAERGRRGLSLETLLELTGKLNVTLDEFLRGEAAAGYRLGRRDHPQRRPGAKAVALPLLDDPEAGLRAYVVVLPPGASATPPTAHKGVELVAVAQGLVQVSLAGGRPVLRRGETLLAERSGISGWRNLGESEAMLFWILRDGPGLA